MDPKKVSVYYDKEGDMLEVLFERAEADTEPTDHNDVWVRQTDDGRVVGFLVFNLSKQGEPREDIDLRPSFDIPEMVPTDIAAENLGLSVRRMQELLREGRVKGAIKARRDWLVPVPTEITPGTRGPVGVARRGSD